MKSIVVLGVSNAKEEKSHAIESLLIWGCFFEFVLFFLSDKVLIQSLYLF